jgi:tetratricopeptide (TPR) repeat protein
MLTPRFSCVFLLFALSGIAVAQHGRPASGSPSSAVPPFSSATTASPSAQPAIFISGKVVLDDGTELTEPAMIQTICRGRRHSETYSDAHGSFSFRFGDPTQGSAAAISDASSSNVNNNGMGTQARQDLQDCQIQAELAGFSSQAVELNSRIGVMSNIDVGRVPLHRLAHVEGTSISVTSALAPPAARKAFEKGLEQEKKNKWEDAEKSFEKAVQIYPRYATAWYQLGRLQLRNQLSGPSPAQNPSVQSARHSFEQSIAADSKYVDPYHGLAQIAMQAQEWPNVIEITNKLVSLNPVNFPDAYYDNAVANYNLKNFDDAEKSALLGVRVDDAHQIPKLQYLLGMIQLRKQNYQGAAEHMQQFLTLSKDRDDIELGKKGMAEIERSSASAQSPANLDK